MATEIEEAVMSNWKLSAATIASVSACTLLASCLKTVPLSETTRVGFSEEVANVFVSVYPAVPWTSISDKLEPKNNLTTADARALAAVTTQSQVSQFLSTFAAGLAIGLPSRTSSSATTVAADGTATTTSSRKVDPGTLPSSSGASPIALSDANLSPELTKNPFANGLDAASQLMVGTGVFQLAQILDNQISKSLPLKGYQAYLLTFQVNLQPLRRDLPYDAYINLTLMPGSWAKAISASQGVSESANELSPIIVYPLVIADAMESSSVGRSVETIRQAALSLSGVVSNIGASAGVNKSADQLDSILGSDRNSLVTVGRVSDHTLRIRLGAQQQGSRKLALVPRTQNISVVVFAKSGKSADQHLDKLAVITDTEFFDAEKGGNRLDSKRSGPTGRAQLRTDVSDVVTGYGFALNPICSDEDSRALDLLRSLDRGDFGYVSRCLVARGDDHASSPNEPRRSFAPATASSAASAPANEVKTLFTLSGTTLGAGNLLVPPPKGTGLAPFEEARLRRVVAALMTLQTDSRYAKLMVPLQEYRDMATKPPPLDQLAFLNDEKGSSKVILRGAANIEADKLKPLLRVTQNGKELVLLPTAVEVDPAGTTATVTFPPIAASKLMSSKKNPVPGKPDVDVEPAPILLQWQYASDAVPAVVVPGPSYELRMLKADAEPPGNPVSVGGSVLISDATGAAKVILNVAEWDAKKQGALGIRVTGADIRTIEPAVAFDAKRKAVPLTGATVVTLTLGNLTPAQVVQLRTIADKDPVGPPIVLSVEPSRPSNK